MILPYDPKKEISYITQTNTIEHKCKQTLMRVVTCLFALIWSFIGLKFIEANETAEKIVIATASFNTPKSNQHFSVDSNVNVNLTYTNIVPLVPSVVIQKCSSTNSNYTLFAQGTNVKSFALPTNYIGPCTYEAYLFPNNLVSTLLSSVSIVVDGNLTLQTPTAGSKIVAGTNVSVSWLTTPQNNSLPVTVALNCSSTMYQSYVVTSNPYSFLVPNGFYGNSCNFTIQATGYVTSNNPVSVVIAQQLNFSSPIQDSTYPLSDQKLTVTLVSQPLTSISQSVSVNFTCQSGAFNTTTMTINTPTAFYYPNNSYGLCTFTAASSQFYLLAPSPISFYLKYNLSFMSTPSNLAVGSPFQIQINSLPLPTIPSIVNVSLWCNNSSVQNWSDVSLNTPASLNLSTSIQPATNCQFRTDPNSFNFFQANSSSVQVFGTISILNPSTNQSIIPSGSVYNVQWSYVPVNAIPEPIFNVSLTCPEFSTLSVPVQGNSTNFTVPSNVYGDSCSFIIESQGFIPASVSVIISDGLSFSTPIEGQIIYLTTPTIPVELITVNTNISTNITASFTCNSNSQSQFITNVPLNLTVSSSQIGNCSLVTVGQPAYLVPQNLSVNFTLMYVLNFTLIPEALYRGQDFFIEIDTLTLAESVTPVNLSLFCNGSNVASQVWNNVSVNQNVTLNLDVDAPLTLCYFNTSSSSMYDGIVSSDVLVSKVPLVFGLPVNQTIVKQTETLLVAVISSVVPNPIGLSNVVLNCSNGYVTNQLLPIGGTPTNFSYSPELYGLCDLNVVDEVFESSERPVSLDFVYQLSFVDPPTTLYANQNFTVEIESLGTPPVNLSSTNLYLFCDGDPTYEWKNVPLNSVESLQVPANLTESFNCTFFTEGVLKFGVANTTVNTSYIQLYFAQPAQIEFTQNGSFPIIVTSGSVPNPQGLVNVFFNCSANPVSSRNISINLNETVTFDYPLDAYGQCYLTVTTPGYYPPTPKEVIIRFVLSYETLPSPIYVNQPFNITINSTGLPPSNLNTNLTLLCINPSQSYTWPDLNFNEPYTLTIPTTLSPSNDCALATFGGPELIPLFEPTHLYNVQLEFLEPIGGQNFNDSDVFIPLLVAAVNFTSLQEEFNVSFVCLQAGVESNDIPVTSWIEQNYTYPVNSFGNCSVSISSAPPGFNSPPSVPFNINWPLKISAVSDSLFIGQTFEIEITPVLPALLANSTSINLICDGQLNQTWTFVPFGQYVPLTLSTNLTNSTDCVLSSFSDNSYIIDANSNNFVLTKVSVIFDQPVINSTTTIPLSFPLNISTPLNTSINVDIEVSLKCGSSLSVFPAVTNVPVDVSYDVEFDGPCSVEVVQAPSYFDLPLQNDTFYLKYALSFNNPPGYLMQNAFFYIEIDSSALPPVNMSTTNVSLICTVIDSSTVVIETWLDVPFNQQSVLHLGPVPPSASACVLETFSDDDFFIQALTPVSIKMGAAPFGGDLTYITPEESKQFVQSNLLIEGTIDLTILN